MYTYVDETLIRTLIRTGDSKRKNDEKPNGDKKEITSGASGLSGILKRAE